MGDSKRSSRRQQHPFDAYFYGDKDPADKNPLEFPPDAPKICAFCTERLERKDFTAFSKLVPASAICCDCIRLYALVSRFPCDTFSIWFQDKPDYEPLRRGILKRFFSHSGSIRLKKAIAALAIRVLQRNSARLMGETETCRRTGVSLNPIRVALIGQDLEECGSMFKIASEEIGVTFAESNRKDLSNGIAYARLTQFVRGEKRWAEFGIVLCRGFAPATSTDCAVFYACKSKANFSDDIEIIELD